MPNFSIGQQVRRIEEVSANGIAVVLAIDTSQIEDIMYQLQYAEGGTGWWPESTIMNV